MINYEQNGMLRPLIRRGSNFWNGSHAIPLYWYFAHPGEFTYDFSNVNFEVGQFFYPLFHIILNGIGNGPALRFYNPKMTQSSSDLQLIMKLEQTYYLTGSVNSTIQLKCHGQS